MLKLKNRRLITIIMAAFAVILIAGTAYAFVGRGPLVFEGIASVNAELHVVITDAEVISGPFNPDETRIVRPPNPNPPPWETQHLKYIHYYTTITRAYVPVRWRFEVTNIGTLPALITEMDTYTYDFNELDRDSALPWTIRILDDVGDVPLLDRVLQPGESADFYVDIWFDPTIELWDDDMHRNPFPASGMKTSVFYASP